MDFLLSIAWAPILVLDAAYELWPRSGKGTGPITVWFRRHPPWRAGHLFMGAAATTLPTYVALVSLDHHVLAAMVCYGVFWIPLAIHDVIDWLGEHDRYKRFKEFASEKGKKLMANLKPAPKPIPQPS